MKPSFLPPSAVRLSRSLRSACFAAAGLLTVASLSAQTFPLSENSWSNPEFVERFLGSYGALTEREPKITSEEAELFQQLPPLMQAGNYQAAIALLQGAMGPESSAALDYTVGNIALQNSNYPLAERSYREAIRKFPNFLRAYKNLGLAHVQQGDFDAGREMFIKALELGDGSGDTYGLVAYCYLNTGDHAKARDAYAVARVLSPNNRDWVVGYAQSLIATGQYREAISVFQELVQDEPGRGAYYTQIANAYISLQEFETAAQYLEIIRRMDEANAASLGLLGDIYINAGLFDLALEVYLDAYNARGTVSSERTLRVASALLSRGAYAQAERFMAEIEEGEIDLPDDDRAEFLNLKAELALAQGDREAAVETLEEVTAMDPFNGRALLLLGEYFADEGNDPAKAVYYFELAQNIQGFAAEAYTQHARLRVKQQDYARAIDLLEEAQSINYRAAVARYLDAVRRVMDAAR